MKIDQRLSYNAIELFYMGRYIKRRNDEIMIMVVKQQFIKSIPFSEFLFVFVQTDNDKNKKEEIAIQSRERERDQRVKIQRVGKNYSNKLWPFKH